MNGGFWMNKKMRDVIIDVKQIKFFTDYALVRVDWWNRSYQNKNPWLLLSNDLIKIDAVNYDDWEEYSA